MKTRKAFDAAAFAAQHKEELEELGRQLATNYDVPAQRLINAAFASMGVPRFVGGDDRWEQTEAHLNGWEYTRPPRRLIERWARY